MKTLSDFTEKLPRLSLRLSLLWMLKQNCVVTRLTWILMLICVGISLKTFAQGVGVGTTTPHASAALDISSTTKGMLVPRMTTQQRNLIASPSAGLLILNLDDYCFDVYDGANWIKNCGMKVTGIDTFPEGKWTQKPDLIGAVRDGAVGMSINNKGYVGTGSNGNFLNDFWEYNPATSVWTQKADFGGVARSRAVAFSSANGKGYLGTGLNPNPLQDFWEYNPATNVWIQKADFGGGGRYNAVAFNLVLFGYVGTGSDGVAKKDFWQYNPVTNLWTQKADFGGTPRHGGVGFGINGKGYIGTGLQTGSYYKDFWEYTPVTNTWVQKADFAGTARSEAIGFSIGSLGYTGTGNNASNQDEKDFWEYNPVTNLWTQKPDFPTLRRDACAFTANNKGYVGTGTVVGVYKNDLFEFDPYVLGEVYQNTLNTDPETTYSLNDGFWTKESDKTYLTQTANKVGIGTNNPLQKLHVDGNTYISNKLGIGMSSPNAQLQLFNTVANRKIVLYESVNNDHQFYGLGINGGALRYQVPGTADRHEFYAGTSASSSVEIMRIVGNGRVGIGITSPLATMTIARGTAPEGTLQLNGTTYPTHFNYSTDEHTYIRGGKANSHILLNDIGGLGNVGIGTGAPAQKLHVAGSAVVSNNIGIGVNSPNAPLHLAAGIQSRKIVLDDAGNNNDHQFFGFGIGPAIMRYQVNNPADHVFYAGNNPTESVELMRIKGTGKIGLGVTEPNGSLHFANDIINRKIILYEVANNDHQFYGFGINGSILRYQVQGTTDNHVFYAGTGSGSSNELMRIEGNGNVDIAGNVEMGGNADIAGNVEMGGNVDIAGNVEVGRTVATSAIVDVPGWSVGTAICNCPAGTYVISGGYSSNSTVMNFIKSYPNTISSWKVDGYNGDVSIWQIQAYAICARVTN